MLTRTRRAAWGLVLVALSVGGCHDEDAVDDGGGPGTIRFSAALYVANEAAGAANVTLERVGGRMGQLQVAIYCDPDTARPGVDVTGCDDAIVTWAHGDDTPKNFSVTPANDATASGHKTLRWSVFSSGPVVTDIGTPREALMVIRDDEGSAPRVAFTNVRPLFLDLVQPVAAAMAPGDPARLYVAEQIGRIAWFYLDGSGWGHVDGFSSGSNSGGETGLLGLAFDPDFAANGHFYVNYTTGNPLMTRVSRFTATSATTVDAASEQVLLSFPQPFSNHNGGWLGFGPDGKLYVGSGDGGDANDPQDHGQRLDTLLGKVLRINTDGTVPADNPFAGDGDDATLAPIWAFGLRNPWRGGFDRETGDLWMGDVGQGAREEIDLIVAGGNYGWRLCEGSVCGGAPPAGHIGPVFEYTHASVGGGGASVTGGYRYRGPLPAAAGLYFYADFIHGQVWALQYDGTVLANHQVTRVDLPSSFAEGLDGELYLVSYTGPIYRLVGF